MFTVPVEKPLRTPLPPTANGHKEMTEVHAKTVPAGSVRGVQGRDTPENNNETCKKRVAVMCAEAHWAITAAALLTH